ncbi:glutamine cyclotransferase [Coccomyxa subellipsoidea C-169]|uniref:Glutamine cyclotransferase n=1 Tax=Coccomyxa subellipsoidea (strain C-169) TaxID=574566 RepID=I0YMT1_COCSC|nr:glutamine cyclotransferase [Coccomyxa subellipsoidea C-169]EIE19700.1 glutamine cyclotransferase [Coccomyxa subellipsoidea C-169]|eukprot:XP_005644244.1 glutamine cyclotransferase [Coccomyxa subellipsoidea C-169]
MPQVLGLLFAVALVLRAKAQLNLPATPQLFTYDVVKEYPHDPDAFTQGLQFDRAGATEFFWESTGMHGQSTVRQVELESGKVLRSKALDPSDFGEGLTKLGNKLYQEVWQSGKLYEYDTLNFDDVKTLAGPLTDGWGITTDNTSLILSDGSSSLAFVDPATLTVTDGGFLVYALNELEYVNGEIWANIWLTDCIARIDPATGTVKAWILMSQLRTALQAQNIQQTYPMDVLNGIAYDDATGRLFVTGKYWPRLYEVKPRLQSASPNPLELLDARRRCIKSSSGF